MAKKVVENFWVGGGSYCSCMVEVSTRANIQFSY